MSTKERSFASDPAAAEEAHGVLQLVLLDLVANALADSAFA